MGRINKASKHFLKIKRIQGFTLIELIVTIVILGILSIPIGLFASEVAKALVESQNTNIACALAQIEMAKVNNLAYDDPTLRDGYDVTVSPYEGYSYRVRRIVSYADEKTWGTNLKIVRIMVYPQGSAIHKAELITYIANISYGSVL